MRYALIRLEYGVSPNAGEPPSMLLANAAVKLRITGDPEASVYMVEVLLMLIGLSRTKSGLFSLFQISPEYPATPAPDCGLPPAVKSISTVGATTLNGTALEVPPP